MQFGIEQPKPIFILTKGKMSNVIKLVIVLFLNFSVGSCKVNSHRDKIFLLEQVDQAPTFVGGEQSKKEFIRANLKWPSVDFGGSGVVVLTAGINKEGEINFIDVKKSLCSFCDEEAIRVVSKMPRWNPGIKNNKVVNCKVDIPIEFKISYD